MEILNKNAEFSFDDPETCIFETITTAIQAGGVVKVDGEFKTIEDLLEDAREEEVKSRKEDDETEIWNYEPLDCLLTQEVFIIKSLKTFDLARYAVELEKY